MKKFFLLLALLLAGNMMQAAEKSLQQLQQEVRQFAAVNPHHRVVAIKTDPQAKYDAYFQLQNAIVAAYRPLKCQPRVSEVIEEHGEQTEKGGQP